MSNHLQRERKIFERACELATPAERQAFLDKACGPDAALRRQVASLLALAEQAENFFQSGLAQDGLPLTPTASEAGGAGSALEEPGALLGRYRLLQKLGEGGFGAVYEAEQWEPIRRRVALKVIKAGMDTREVIHRFEAERQALAIMDHPNVARVLDAGATQTGRPYFVMELVPGVSLTAYCEERQLTVAERLRLFLPVCQAIQHAHQKGLIHRDLKPSNILVTVIDGRPVPKVIDFGIAKAIHQPLTDQPLVTRLGRLAGTPAYMSPEQADPAGLDIDTRSDIYSLGVVLYELLAGRPPFDAQRLRQAGYSEALRILQEEEPPPPSTRLSTLGPDLPQIAQRRRVPPERLKTLLEGDLDWIVLKALEKDRTRRYPTALALGQDLECHLRDEPVAAGPPGFRYRCAKFARRHRPAVWTAAGMLLALLAGLGLFIGGFLQAQRERDRARAAEHHARRLAYASDMNLAQQALEQSNLGLARRLLSQHRPGPAQADLRDWEWRYLWRQCQGQALAALCQYSNPVYSLSCSADGQFLAVGGYDGGLQIWDLPARRLHATLQRQGKPCLAAYSGRLLAATDEQGLLRLWQGTNSAPLLSQEPPYPEIHGLACSADGRTIAASTIRGLVLLCDVATGQSSAYHTGFRQPRMHGGDILLSHDGAWFATGGREGGPGAAQAGPRGQIRIAWKDSGRERIAWPAHNGTITALALSPDDRRLASGAGFSDNTVRLWDTQSGEALACLAEHTAWITALAFSPDARFLAACTASNTLHILQLPGYELVAHLPLPPELMAMTSLKFVRDGRRLVAAGDNQTDSRTVLVWDCDTWQIIARWPIPGREAIPTMDVSSNGAFLAFGGGKVHVWNLLTGQLAVALQTHFQSADAVAFSPDGRLLATASQDGLVKLWETGSWRQTAQLRGHLLGIHSLAFSPEGRRLATGSLDQEAVKLWDLQTQRQVLNLPLTNALITALRFSPDSRHLLALASGQTAYIWSCPGWSEINRLEQPLIQR